MSALVRGGRAVETVASTAGSRETEESVRIVRRRASGESRRYSWLEDYLARLDGKEARAEYFARLD